MNPFLPDPIEPVQPAQAVLNGFDSLFEKTTHYIGELIAVSLDEPVSESVSKLCKRLAVSVVVSFSEYDEETDGSVYQLLSDGNGKYAIAIILYWSGNIGYDELVSCVAKMYLGHDIPDTVMNKLGYKNLMMF